MTGTTPDTAVRHQIEVAAPIERTFAVFTEQFDKIKPHEQNLLDSPIAETIFERRVGGHVYDRAEDGSQCRWARVLVFEPPHRFVISWDLNPQWQVETDLNRSSEVEVTFVAVDGASTRVELEHRHLDRHLDGWERIRDGVSSDDGWPLYLRRFADLLSR